MTTKLATNQRRLQIAVVGPTNVGKTSLIRTLASDPGFGKVGEEAGCTVQALTVRRHLRGGENAEWDIFDTPGFEDTDSIFRVLERDPTREQIIEAFRNQAKLWEIIEVLLQSDVALYVIETSRQPSDDHHFQLSTIRSLGVPVVPVFHRFLGHEPLKNEWEDLLRKHALQNDSQEIDARALEPDQEERLLTQVQRRLKEGSPYQQFVSRWIEQSRIKRKDRCARAGVKIHEFIKRSLKLRREDAGVESEKVGLRMIELGEKIDQVFRKLVVAYENKLKREFGFERDCLTGGSLKFTPFNRNKTRRFGINIGKYVLGGGIAFGLLGGLFALWRGGGIIGFAMAGLPFVIVGALVGAAANYKFDKKRHRVGVCVDRSSITAAVEHLLRLVQRLYYSGSAAVRDGTKGENPAPIVLGTFELSPESRRAIRDQMPNTYPALSKFGFTSRTVPAGTTAKDCHALVDSATKHPPKDHTFQPPLV